MRSIQPVPVTCMLPEFCTGSRMDSVGLSPGIWRLRPRRVLYLKWAPGLNVRSRPQNSPSFGNNPALSGWSGTFLGRALGMPITTEP